jgi:predicted HTH domain antitoxin
MILKMDTIALQVPSMAGIDDFEVKMLVAGGLYTKGKLSAGQAAAVVGLSKVAFLELLGPYGFSIFGYDAEDLSADWQTFQTWKKS